MPKYKDDYEAEDYNHLDTISSDSSGDESAFEPSEEEGSFNNFSEKEEEEDTAPTMSSSSRMRPRKYPAKKKGGNGYRTSGDREYSDSESELELFSEDEVARITPIKKRGREVSGKSQQRSAMKGKNTSRGHDVRNNNVLEFLSDTGSEVEDTSSVDMPVTKKRKQVITTNIIEPTPKRKPSKSSSSKASKQRDNGPFSTSTSRRQSKRLGSTLQPIDTSRSSSSTKPSPPKVLALSKEEEAKIYLQGLSDSLEKKRINLSQIESTVVNTGRTIQPLKSWKGLWPPIREFFQNTIDHLGLMDGKTGKRRECIDICVSTPDNGNAKDTTRIAFKCQAETLATIDVSENELIIEQAYTYPIPSRALDTGVPDSTKGSYLRSESGANSEDNQAGGFGDGFKTAAAALLNLNQKKGGKKGGKKSRNVFRKLEWIFYMVEDRKKVKWDFHGLTREKIATFEESQVLRVGISKDKMSKKEVNYYSSSFAASDGGTSSKGQSYIMRQTIEVAGIGQAFREEIAPRLVVFWDFKVESLLCSMGQSANGTGADYMAPVCEQPYILRSKLGNIRPMAGIYVKGIWVKQSKIKGTAMVFGSRLNVSGRDRNDCDEEELLDAATHVIRQCSDRRYLRKLLEPLRGSSSSVKRNEYEDSDVESHFSSDERRHCGKRTSWLLESPRFFDTIINKEKNFLLQDIFQIPEGSLCVSSKSINSSKPFIKWAISFLEKHGAKLYYVNKGANSTLFKDVSLDDITEKCVDILRRKLKDGGVAQKQQSSLKKLLKFMGSSTKIFATKELNIVFEHNNMLFIPETPLTNAFVCNVLGVCFTELDRSKSNPEAYSSLVQAIFEEGADHITPTVVKKVLERAKKILRERKKFTVLTADDDGGDGDGSDEGLTNESTSASYTETRRHWGIKDLLREVEHLTERCEEQDRPQFIAENDFEEDLAGDDHPSHPPSNLRLVEVSESLGSNYMLFDEETAANIENWTSDEKMRLSKLRDELYEAQHMVEESFPAIKPLTDCIDHGYDGNNNTYEGFCDARGNIVINLYAYLTKVEQVETSPELYPRGLIYDFVTVITHEIAHLLKPNDGHGPLWRNAHMLLLQQVMQKLEVENWNSEQLQFTERMV